MCVRASLRALHAVALAAAVALSPAATAAAEVPAGDTPLLVGIWEFVKRIAGAEEGGPGVDPLGLADEGDEQVGDHPRRAACAAVGDRQTSTEVGEDVCK